MRCFHLTLTFFVIGIYLYAGNLSIADTTIFQSNTEHKKNIFNARGSKFIIPTAFISYGVVRQVSKPLRQFDKDIDKEVRKHVTKHRGFDSYLPAVSMIAVYGLDGMGVKAKNNFRDRTFVAITSHVFMFATVQSVKKATGVERPDGSNMLSFPSGHTAVSFTGAHILFKEYKHVSPWIGVVGYAAATTVGTMRVLNRRHWASDVVAGAGVGILSAEIGYMLLPVFRKIIGAEQSKSNLVIMPVVGNNLYGLGMACVF